MNPAQKIQLERVKIASFNDFDGEKVAKDLEENEDLYQAFVIGRFKYCQLIELRDLQEGYVNVDTLYVLTTKQNLDKFLALSRKWKHDELGYYQKIDGKIHTTGTIDFRDSELHFAFGAPLNQNQVLIRLWWD